ncbi:MAG: PKD domain-containing protein, partial [Bacteroidota bacterium]|nr:PKD domain-containing protein [Bacteroidota bacterium]
TPEEGATFVRSYQKVTYKNIYKGIDIEFFVQENDEQKFKYNFIVHPGADASLIKLKYKGANKIKLKNEKLHIETSNGNFYEDIPESWILENKEKISVRYKNSGENTFGFSCGEYSSYNTLIIDPMPNLEWGTYYGGTNVGYGIATDQNGNVYVTGWTYSTTAIATSGAHQPTFGGGIDAFIVKFNTSGQRLWGTYYGGTSNDYGNGITTDQNGNVYVSGSTHSTTAIATSGSHQSTFGGGIDAFIVKFNSSGQRLWGTYYGGSGYDSGPGIATDKNGNIYVSGSTSSTSAISTSGAHQTSFGGYKDVFIAKFNSSGQIQWGTYYGGNGNDWGYGIATDQNANVYVTGCTTYTNSISAIVTSGAHQTSFGGYVDGFITKFNSSGQRQWGTYYGGSGYDWGYGIVTDQSANVYVTGKTSSTSAISTSGAHQTTHGGVSGEDVYIVKFNSSGQRQWGTYYGGSYDDEGYGIVIDQNANVYITGMTRSTSAIATSCAYQTSISGMSCDVFITKFNSMGQRQWGTYYGGNGYEYGYGIAIDQNANVYITGRTSSTSAIATVGAHQTSIGSFQDAFIAKFIKYYPICDTISINVCDSFYFNGKFLYSSGTYYNTLANYYGCDSFITLYLNILPSPKTQFSINDSAQCLSGNLFNFTNNSTIDSGSITYLWFFGDNDSSALISPSHSYISDDTFYVKLLAVSDSGCTDSAYKSIIVYPMPETEFAIQDSLQCLQGNKFRFTNISTINSGSLNYKWNFGDGDTSTQENPHHSYLNADTFNVKMLATSTFGCKDSTSKLAYVVAFPKLQTAFDIKDSALCLKDNLFQFTNQSTIDSGSFTSFWDFGDGDTLGQTNAQHHYQIDDTFRVKLLLTSDHGCKDSIMRSVYVCPMPQSGFTIDNTSQCLFGNQFNFTDTSIIKWGNLSSEWHLGDNNISQKQQLFYSFKNNDTFLVNLISISDFNCRDTVQQSVFVHPTPQADFTINDSNQCFKNNNFQFTDKTFLPYGNLNYYWDFGDNNNSTIQNPNHSYLTVDPFEVKMFVTTTEGCMDSISARVYTLPMPVAAFSFETAQHCLDDNLFHFNNLSSVPFGNLTYEWLFDDGQKSTAVSPSHHYQHDDIYNIILTAETNHGCVDSISHKVTVYPMPVVLFEINDSTQCLDHNSFDFTNLSSISSGSLSYQWIINSQIFSSFNLSNLNFKKWGKYSVKLISNSNQNCMDSISKNIYVHPM